MYIGYVYSDYWWFHCVSYFLSEGVGGERIMQSTGTSKKVEKVNEKCFEGHTCIRYVEKHRKQAWIRIHIPEAPSLPL